MVNMGSMLVFYFIYIVLLIVSPLLAKCRNCCRCIKKLSKTLDRTVYWTQLITLMNETYMIIAVCALLNLRALSFLSPGLIAMTVICILLTLFIILVPILFICKLKANFRQLSVVQFR